MKKFITCPAMFQAARRGGGADSRAACTLSLALILTLTVSCGGGAGPADRPAAAPDGSSSGGQQDDAQPPADPFGRYLIGAYYYVWYPGNFDQGYLRATLNPSQSPVLGRYNSSDVGVAERHIAWASRHGIDFFAVDWWPNRPQQNRAFTGAFLRAANIDDIKFVIFYETQNLGQQSGATMFTGGVIDRLVADVVDLAVRFFDHPSYLKVNGRPVIIFYLTRTFHGGFRMAFNRLREELANRGYDPYFIADEVYWGVMAAQDDVSIEPVWSPDPQVNRIGLFDAITSYNMYNEDKTRHAGYGAASTYLDDVAATYTRYIEAAGASVDFVPNVVPGYNDRGVRPGADHFVIARAWEPGGAAGSFFSEYFDRIAFPFIDDDLNMILITSWNEWNEDTNIEPVNDALPTTRDASGSGGAFTQGYEYFGYGTAYLEVARDKAVAAAGRVTGGDGAAAKSITVCAWKDGVAYACDLTDRDGYYTLSRLQLDAGEYETGVEGGAVRTRVEVNAAATVTDVDFVLD